MGADESNNRLLVGSTYPVNAVSGQEADRVEPIITPEQLRRRFFFGIPLVSFMPDPITGKRDVLRDEDLEDHINRAIAQAELDTRYFYHPSSIRRETAF